MAKAIPVLEIFGPTIQGEGMVIGQNHVCQNGWLCYSCSWCDSSFTWDGSAKHDIQWLEAEDIVKRIKKNRRTGFFSCHHFRGNPALLKQMESLIDLLHEEGIDTALETQGTMYQEWF